MNSTCKKPNGYIGVYTRSRFQQQLLHESNKNDMPHSARENDWLP